MTLFNFFQNCELKKANICLSSIIKSLRTTMLGNAQSDFSIDKTSYGSCLHKMVQMSLKLNTNI